MSGYVTLEQELFERIAFEVRQYVDRVKQAAVVQARKDAFDEFQRQVKEKSP